MSLGAVNQNIVKRKFLCDADGGEDVVGAVAVKMRLELAGENRNKCITFCIKIRRIGVLILLRLAAVIVVALCFLELLADECSGRHTGHRGFGFIVIAVFRILAQSKFHGNRLF